MRRTNGVNQYSAPTSRINAARWGSRRCRWAASWPMTRRSVRSGRARLAAGRMICGCGLHRANGLPHDLARLRSRQLHCLQRLAVAQQGAQPAAGQRPPSEGQQGPCDMDGQQQWRQPGHQGFSRRECRQLHGQQCAGTAVQRNRQCAGQLLQRRGLHRQHQR
ncbi:hypothetical protein G6F32_014671 [Rhizopus arrhizus]|nr:hypothetical protein G6F32_014671 [Rhizopus arrhizus]